MWGEECSATVSPCTGYSTYRLRNRVQACQLGYMSTCNTIDIPLSKMVTIERVPLLLLISWVPGSNLSPDTDHQKLFLKLLSYSSKILGCNFKLRHNLFHPRAFQTIFF